MLDLAERLEDAGHAYRTDHDNLYYEVGTFEDYGKLSGNSLDDLRAGHRTAGHVEHDKRDPADFALWKSAGEQRALKWPSRWGEGFPGWHLECSAMALKYLGERFDIHTGGIDNVFPHHEDEIAQSAPLVGGPPATVWVHGEHLLMSGRKMAKSAGNFERVTELAERGIDPLALRYLALTSRYRHKLDYSDESVTGAAAALESLRARLRALGPPPADGPWAAPAALRAAPAGERPDGIAADPGGHGGADTPGPADRAHAPSAPLSPEGRDLHDRFTAAIDDDLDTSTAVAIARETLRAPLPEDERRWLLLDFDYVLGLDLDRVWATGTAADDTPAEVRELVEARAIARNARDFAARRRTPRRACRPRLGRGRRPGRLAGPTKGGEPMKVGLMLPMGEDEASGHVPPWSTLRDMALTAEERGLDSVYLADHLLFRDGRRTEGIHEAWTVLSAVAALTSRVEIGPLVLAVPFRNPALTAKMAAELDEVSGGRLVLGLGCGWHEPEFEAFDFPFDHRVGRFEEALEIILPLLREGRVRFDGRWHRANAELPPRGPRPASMPILIAGKGPRMLRLVARHADRWNAAWYGPPRGGRRARRADRPPTGRLRRGRPRHRNDDPHRGRVRLLPWPGSRGRRDAARRRRCAEPPRRSRRCSRATPSRGIGELISHVWPNRPEAVAELAKAAELARGLVAVQ